jgi:hypothetical protein
LESTHTIKRNGKVDVDVEFDLISEGVTVKRGPCLNFLRVYRGPLGLVLDNEMEVTGVWRNGAPESYFEDRSEFETSLFVGGRDRLLEPGSHRYRVTYSMNGDWKKAGNHFMGAFDMAGAFKGLQIDSAVANLKLPEGVSLDRFSSSVTGIADPRPGYETTQNGGGIRVETKGAMQGDHSLFVNAVWHADSFASQSQWIQVLRQHPRIPLMFFFAILLLGIFLVLITRVIGRSRSLKSAALRGAALRGAP